MSLPLLFSAVLIAQAEAPVLTPPPEDAIADQASPAAADPDTPAERGYDLGADKPPPPSASEHKRRAERLMRDESEGRDTLSQVGRTLLSLAFVVALIYAAGRFAKSKFGNMRMPIKSGQHIVVKERVAIDAQRSLFLVHISGDPDDSSGAKRLLLGSGERGIHLIADLGTTGSTLGTDFAGVLKTGAATPADESDQHAAT